MEFEIDFMKSYDRDSVAAELRRVVELSGKNRLSMREIDRLSRVSSKTIIAKFGTMAQAHEAAGLDAPSYRKYTDEQLFTCLRELWAITLKESGRSPRLGDVKKYGLACSAHTIRGRFGTWRKALVAASDAWEGRTPQPFNKTGRERKPISPHTRFEVFKRDLYTCQLCRRAGVELVLDHVTPLCLGGTNAKENLQALCVECNLGKAGNLQ
jgi:HNH endonuclease